MEIVQKFCQRPLSNGRVSSPTFVQVIPLRTCPTVMRLAFYSQLFPQKVLYNKRGCCQDQSAERMLHCPAHLHCKKKRLQIIRKAKGLYSFPKHISHLQRQCICRHNTKAWMTSTIFIEYVKWLNNKMPIQLWKIPLFIDNCPSHTPVTFLNVTIKFLPRNMMSKLQPLNTGITALVKKAYSLHVMAQLTTAKNAFYKIVPSKQIRSQFFMHLFALVNGLHTS